jgi:hypothetical protein
VAAGCQHFLNSIPSCTAVRIPFAVLRTDVTGVFQLFGNDFRQSHILKLLSTRWGQGPTGIIC